MTLTVVNPYAGGHYGQHLAALLHGWSRGAGGRRPTDRLAFVVAPCVGREHPDLPVLAHEVGATWTETATDVPSPHATPHREAWMARTLRRAAAQTGADGLFLPYLDHFLLTAALVPVGAPLAGVLFRPSFHYAEIGSPPRTATERLREAVRREILRAVLHRAHRVFTLDETAVEPMRRLGPANVPVGLPEVLDLSVAPRRPAFLDALDPARRILLCVGALDARKGLGVTVDALERLPPDLQRRLTLVLAGRIAPSERPEHIARLDRLRARTDVKLVIEDRYLDEAEIQPTIEAADLVLVPYQRHVGSSGILIRAATAGRPVLASAYGLVGAHVRRHGLGETVDATSAESVADAIRRDLDGTGASARFDAARARAFAAGNSADAYAETIFRHLLAA